MVTLAGVHEALKAVDPHPLSRHELYGLISDLEKLRSRVDERLMAAKAALDSLGDTGADSAVVGRSVGRRSERQAKKDRVTARGLAEMPTLADGLAEGRLNVEHAAIVAAAAEETSPEVAAELVPLAESIPADLFARKAREFVGRHTSAAEAEERHRRQRQRGLDGTRSTVMGQSRSMPGSTKPPAKRCGPPADAASTSSGETTADATEAPTTSVRTRSVRPTRSPT